MVFASTYELEMADPQRGPGCLIVAPSLTSLGIWQRYRIAVQGEQRMLEHGTVLILLSRSGMEDGRIR